MKTIHFKIKRKSRGSSVPKEWNPLSVLSCKTLWSKTVLPLKVAITAMDLSIKSRLKCLSVALCETLVKVSLGSLQLFGFKMWSAGSKKRRKKKQKRPVCTCKCVPVWTPPCVRDIILGRQVKIMRLQHDYERKSREFLLSGFTGQQVMF